MPRPSVWRRDEHGWGVAIGGGTAYPFAKVAKLFANGLDGGDSILSFFDVTNTVLSMPPDL